MNNNDNNTLIPLKKYMENITEEEKAFIEEEKKYYKIAVALRKKREKLGLTQEKLSKLSKIPRTTISKIESGMRNTTLQTLTSIAKAMGSTFELKFQDL